MSAAGWWVLAAGAALVVADVACAAVWFSTESDIIMLVYLLLRMASAAVVLAGLVLAGILIYREARGRVSASAVAACLSGVALSSLLLVSIFSVLLVIPGVALGLAVFYMGRRGRRFRELPSVVAFAAAWHQFWSRRRATRPRYAWRMTQAQLPFFFAIVACAAAHFAVVIFGAAHQVTGHLEEALAAMGAVYLGGAALLLAVVLAASALAMYPWAQYQHAVVLHRFEGVEEAPVAGRSLAIAGVLLLTDFALMTAVFGPAVLIIIAAHRDWPGWPFLIVWPSWPVLVLVAVLFRMHYREVVVTRGLGLLNGVSVTLRMLRAEFFEMMRGLVLQLACYIPLVLLAWFAAPLVLIIVAFPAAVLAGLHALVWWGLGYQGSGHLWVLLIEVPGLSLLFLMFTGFITSPLALFQALYRVAYVKKLIRADV